MPVRCNGQYLFFYWNATSFKNKVLRKITMILKIIKENSRKITIMTNHWFCLIC